MHFFLLLYKNICYGNSFELPQQVEAILMSTHNIYFYKGNQKIILQKASFNMLLINSSADLSLKSDLIRLIFYYKFVQ